MEAKRDQNRVPTLLAVSNADGVTPITLYADPTTHRLLVDLAGGSGDVVGPASAIDGDIAVFDTTTGKLIKDGGKKISDLQLALTNPITGTGTINEIAYFPTSSTVGSLAVATYPSLTELSYVKGATSSIQTQLGGKLDKSTYDANSILYATTDNTPVALTVGEQTLVGRATGGAISAIAIDSDLSSTSANDDTVPSAKATKAMGDLKLPLAGGTMTGDLTIGDAKQIVLTAPSADVTCTGISTSAFNSGYTSSAVGDLVYLDSSATWQKADADAIATSGGMLGIALAVAASGASLKVALPGSFVRVNSWNWTVGATLYVSETAGGIATAIPTGADGVVRVIGFACNADYIYFYPSPGNSTVVA